MAYSTKIVEQNSQAHQDLLGVKLGHRCIKYGIPVVYVAFDLDVSRAVVYRWFTGQNEVGKHLYAKVQEYYKKLPGLHAPK